MSKNLVCLIGFFSDSSILTPHLSQSLLSKLDSVSMEGVREAELEEVSTLPEPSPLLLRWSGVKATDGEGGLSLPTWAQASQKGEIICICYIVFYTPLLVT